MVWQEPRVIHTHLASRKKRLMLLFYVDAKYLCTQKEIILFQQTLNLNT
jgi:hypothetical protein